ncbi:FtsQ-type POTRA domain-containing protein [Erythrobacter sp. LQ02-29]|uniref:cell division protein FtsQ/DivIB n=1 Tax=Erythrobacter sp. LQ02-29 TaxID=2920384 RepID=UPI001F4DA5A9|nr:FtsQ-type POTRA domain-containing protein [Erythrobacter sp. LQ02-29]MCP9222538.1 FtsQ-type POTRA domain-containing protein [Erythrobacter sp. LQ02-29]
MATVGRKPQGVRRATAAKTRAARARHAKRQGQGVVDRLVAMLPITEEQLHRVFLFLILGVAAMLVWLVASLAGVPALAQAQLATIASDAGFEARHVRVTGVERMNELKVYEAAFSQKDKPMPLVDLEALRADLVAMPWVEDARVSRQLPDRLVIDIVERTPHAVLARNGKLTLIDGDGVELEPISAANSKGMLRVSGAGAAKQVANLSRLLDTAPALKPQVISAEWVGNRRWNLTFATDQLLVLPQGREEASKALIHFARMDGQNRLLGGKVAAFDMRVPDRIYMRVPGRGDLGEAN